MKTTFEHTIQDWTAESVIDFNSKAYAQSYRPLVVGYNELARTSIDDSIWATLMQAVALKSTLVLPTIYIESINESNGRRVLRSQDTRVSYTSILAEASVDVLNKCKQINPEAFFIFSKEPAFCDRLIKDPQLRHDCVVQLKELNSSPNSPFSNPSPSDLNHIRSTTLAPYAASFFKLYPALSDEWRKTLTPLLFGRKHIRSDHALSNYAGHIYVQLKPFLNSPTDIITSDAMVCMHEHFGIHSHESIRGWIRSISRAKSTHQHSLSKLSELHCFLENTLQTFTSDDWESIWPSQSDLFPVGNALFHSFLDAKRHEEPHASYHTLLSNVFELLQQRLPRHHSAVSVKQIHTSSPQDNPLTTSFMESPQFALSLGEARQYFSSDDIRRAFHHLGQYVPSITSKVDSALLLNEHQPTPTQRKRHTL
jgi:hypothetical protein